MQTHCDSCEGMAAVIQNNQRGQIYLWARVGGDADKLVEPRAPVQNKQLRVAQLAVFAQRLRHKKVSGHHCTLHRFH